MMLYQGIITLFHP
ncbi:hypothetical protein MXB_3404 [Myxobolus squamalis]|nr:hypothetical protein MXB_3404 [Myxobolus squamalis]